MKVTLEVPDDSKLWKDQAILVNPCWGDRTEFRAVVVAVEQEKGAREKYLRLCAESDTAWDQRNMIEHVRLSSEARAVLVAKVWG